MSTQPDPWRMLLLLNVYSVELVGDFKNNGREWRSKGDPERVKVHDFVEAGKGRASPYGIYDIAHDLGWVNVGVDHDTSAFAVESIRQWWRSMGSPLYPDADRLFSHISMNWRARPLISHEVIVSLIASTTTSTGLRVESRLDTGQYPAGIKVSDEELASINLERHEFHGEWNYTIRPRSP